MILHFRPAKRGINKIGCIPPGCRIRVENFCVMSRFLMESRILGIVGTSKPWNHPLACRQVLKFSTYPGNAVRNYYWDRFK